MPCPLKVNPNEHPHTPETEALNVFSAEIASNHEISENTRTDALKFVNCLRFIKLNETFIRYAVGHPNDETIYHYYPDDKNKNVIRDFDDTAIHFVRSAPDGKRTATADELINNFANHISEFETAIAVAKDKDRSAGFINALNFDVPIGFFDHKLSAAFNYSKLLKRTTALQLVSEQEDSTTSLLKAIHYGFVDIVEDILGNENSKVDLLQEDLEGYTALMRAIDQNKIEIAKLLINSHDCSEELLQKPIFGFTPFLLAQKKGLDEIVSVIKNKADENNWDINKRIFDNSLRERLNRLLMGLHRHALNVAIAEYAEAFSKLKPVVTSIALTMGYSFISLLAIVSITIALSFTVLWLGLLIAESCCFLPSLLVASIFALSIISPFPIFVTTVLSVDRMTYLIAKKIPLKTMMSPLVMSAISTGCGAIAGGILLWGALFDNSLASLLAPTLLMATVPVSVGTGAIIVVAAAAIALTALLILTKVAIKLIKEQKHPSVDGLETMQPSQNLNSTNSSYKILINKLFRKAPGNNLTERDPLINSERQNDSTPIPISGSNSLVGAGLFRSNKPPTGEPVAEAENTASFRV